MSALQAISQIVTPTILVSASGLLLLGLQNKYARIVDRIRALRDIERGLKRHAQESQRNILKQLKLLLKRAHLLRTAIFCLYVGILFFILASMAIGLSAWRFISDAAVIIFFGTALCAMFLGIVHAVLDVQNSFQIILLELKRKE